jgi:hypothetical protein
VAALRRWGQIHAPLTYTVKNISVSTTEPALGCRRPGGWEGALQAREVAASGKVDCCNMSEHSRRYLRPLTAAARPAGFRSTAPPAGAYEVRGCHKLGKKRRTGPKPWPASPSRRPREMQLSKLSGRLRRTALRRKRCGCEPCAWQGRANRIVDCGHSAVKPVMEPFPESAVLGWAFGLSIAALVIGFIVVGLIARHWPRKDR